jgi:hypothetical protein
VVVAEGVGDDGGRHLQDLLSDRCGAAGGRGDAEVVDQGGQSVRVQRLVGSAPGEQPAGVAIRCGVHVVAVLDPGQEVFREERGDRGGRLSESQPDLVVVVDDVVDGEADNPAAGLRVEQDDDRVNAASQR